MKRRIGLFGVLAVGMVACEQNVVSPATCPAFCPGAEIQIIDTLLTGAVTNDVWFRGYLSAHEATTMQLVNDGVLDGRGLIRFLPFGERIALDSVTTAPIIQIDSFRLDLILRDRSADVSGLEILVHRIPLALADSLATFADAEPLIADSTIIGIVTVPDSVFGDTVSVVLPGDVFPTFEADERQVAVGLSVRASGPAFATLRTREVSRGGLLTRFALADSGGTNVPRSDVRGSQFDGFVHGNLGPAVGPEALVVGGLPAARAFLRFDSIPAFIIDSAPTVAAQARTTALASLERS